MNLNCSDTLMKNLENYMKSLDCKARNKVIACGYKDLRFWPAASVGCEYGNIKECESSGRWKGRINPIHPVVKNACAALGVAIEEEINGNLNGCCAEDHAASEVITKEQAYHRQILKIEQLTFTPAYRARTRKVKKPCPNCKIVFAKP